ncbi:hypothetical protein TNCV_3810481 [Trichonephila clavipes]|nr:hypothetical protein TNCV_3810481 [Trichonephila clavipes]
MRSSLWLMPESRHRWDTPHNAEERNADAWLIFKDNDVQLAPILNSMKDYLSYSPCLLLITPLQTQISRIAGMDSLRAFCCVTNNAELYVRTPAVLQQIICAAM